VWKTTPKICENKGKKILPGGAFDDGSSFKSVRGWHQHATGHDISCPYREDRWRHKVAATTVALRRMSRAIFERAVQPKSRLPISKP